MHLAHRVLSEEIKLDIKICSANPAVWSQEIYQAIRQLLMKKQTENYHHQLQRQEFSGQSPMQALITTFQKEGIPHIICRAEDDFDQITGLFWLYPGCLDMWRQFPWVLQMDNTYKTNNYQCPFFEVTGVTNIALNFNVTFRIFDNEREDGFNWLTGQLEALHWLSGISRPHVTITNFDRALKNCPQ